MVIRVDRIRELLKIQNISAKKMLSDLHQSPNNLTRWEKGNVKNSFSSVSAIADYLHVDVRYLTDLTDSPHGDDIIENATDLLLNSCDNIESFDNDNGTGQEYVLYYKGKSYNFQEHEYRNLCQELLTLINETQLFTIEKFCQSKLR